MVVRCGSLVAELISGIVLARGNPPVQVGIFLAVLVFGLGLIEEGFGLLRFLA